MAKVSAGSYDLNKWLYGGYESGVISVIYGSPGSGKTNFCLQAAVSQAKKGNKVIYLDTEGGFSSDRVKQLVGEKYKEALENIFLLSPVNFSEQEEMFSNLLKYVKEGVSLIIVDGMTMLYRLDFADAKEQDLESMRKVNSVLAKQMRVLAEISRKKEIPVIVTNQIYKWEGGTKMVGGDILQYWGKCLIELTRDGNKRSAHLRKHRSLGEKSLPFFISDVGIKKRGWL